MAGNRPFANLDRLASLIRPDIQLPNPNVNQGNPITPTAFQATSQTPKVAANPYTPFPDKLNLGDRYEQPQLKTTKHLAQFFLSDVGTGKHANTKFRTDINLENRIKQPALGTTAHLAQFFLSDVFTGFIKVKKVKPLAEQTIPVTLTQPTNNRTIAEQGGSSPIKIKRKIIQGGTHPTLAIRNIEARQGIINDKGVLFSSIVLEEPTTSLEKLEENGVFEMKGQFYSTVATTEPVENVDQGSTTLEKKKETQPQQGGQEYTEAKSVAEIQAEQGIITRGIAQYSAIDPSKVASTIQQGIVRIGGQESSLIALTEPIGEVNQGYVISSTFEKSSVVDVKDLRGPIFQGDGITPTPPSPPRLDEDGAILKHGAAVLRTASFVLGTLVLRVTPEIYQGSEDPQNEIPGDATYGSHGGHEIVDPRSSLIVALLNPQGATSYTKADLTTGITYSVGGGSLDKYEKAGDVGESRFYQNTEPYSQKETVHNAIGLLNQITGDDITDALKNAGIDAKFADLTKADNLTKNSSVKDLVDSDGQLNKSTEITNALGSNDETTIIALLKKKIDENKIKDYKKGFNSSTAYKVYTDIGSYQQIIDAAAKPPTADAVRPSSKITIAGDSDTVTFDAFIKTFADSVNTSYQDFKHIGQQDTFKVFVGSTRQIGISFVAIAMPGTKDFLNSNLNAKALLQKINTLMNICSVGQISGDYIKGPIVKVSVVGMLSELRCACTSVKVDMDVTETPWDVDDELPQSYTVSLDLTPLAMHNDQLLTYNGKFYA